MPRNLTFDLTSREWRVRPFEQNVALFQQAWLQEPVPSLEYPAEVPGDVTTDAWRAEGGPHPYRDLESRKWEWTAARDWLYRVEFEAPALEGRQARLEFDAVDYQCTVWLNGQQLGSHKGASDPFRLAATSALREGTNRLLVLVHAAPPEPGQIGRTSEVRTWKPRYAYGWDWNVRLIPLGIYGGVRLVLDEGVAVEDDWWRVRLAPDHASADLLLLASVRSAAMRRARVVGEARSPGGEVVARAECSVTLAAGSTEVQAPLSIDAPELWYPSGYGAQPLYEVTLTVEPEGLEPVRVTRRLGIRGIEWVRTETAPEASLPYTPVVNGERVYLTGFNWSPPGNLHGLMRERFAPTVRMARECGANVLRVWGGSQLPRPDFYEACDECGILVWQEFCQSSSGIDNRPPTDDAYIANAVREACGIVRRVRASTCLVAWSGGNELMDDQGVPLPLSHPTIAALGAVACELDPDRFYFPTSASGPMEFPSLDRLGDMHDVHGPWTFDAPTGHYRLYDGVDALLHSEMGAPGAANLESLDKWISTERLWPPDATNPIWMGHGAWWINAPQVESLFGKTADLETFALASQWLQCEALRYALLAARRRQWRCAGTIIWQFNDAYPTTSCTAVLGYDLDAKPAFHAVRHAYGPVVVSARYDGLAWEGRDRFEAGIYISSRLAGAGACRATAQILDLAGDVRAEWEERLTLTEAGTVHAFDLAHPTSGLGAFVLRLRLENAHARRDAGSDTLLSARGTPMFAELWDQTVGPLAVERTDEGLVVRNEGGRLAPFVTVRLWGEDGRPRIPEENAFALRPGEARVVWTSGEPVTHTVRAMGR